MKRIGGPLLALAGVMSLAIGSAPAAAAQKGMSRILLFTHSTGYRHASIEPGAAAIQALGPREKVVIVPSADPNIFSAERLKEYDAIIFLSNSTDPKKPESEWFQGSRREALQKFVGRGGGVVAIHAASDSHYHWPWFGRLIGGRFTSHPEGTPRGLVRVVDAKHPSTRKLPATMSRVDEWYYFDDFNPEAKLLLSLDPQSIGQKDVNPNPVSWSHEFEGGRVFYTAMGHTPESYSDRNFLDHLAGGLRWVLRRK